MQSAEKFENLKNQKKTVMFPAKAQTSEALLLVSTCFYAVTNVFFAVYLVPGFLHFVLFAGDFTLEMAPKYHAEVLLSVPKHRKAVMYSREKNTHLMSFIQV